MKDFNEWLKENHPELIDEGWKDWAGKMALGGALAAGAMGYSNSNSQPVNAHHNQIQQQMQSLDQMNFNLGGPRKVSVSINTEGHGQVKFLVGKMDKPQELVGRFAKEGIIKAAGGHGMIRGFSVTNTQQQGNWVVADFSWETVN